jgi:hypothetical protein
VKRYSEAIRLAPWAPVLYTNRALALLQRGWEGDALCALRDTETGGWAGVGATLGGLPVCACFWGVASYCFKSHSSLCLAACLHPLVPALPAPSATPAAVCLDPTWHKAHYRRLQALLAAGMLQVSLAAPAASPWRCRFAGPGMPRCRACPLCSPPQAVSPAADHGCIPFTLLPLMLASSRPLLPAASTSSIFQSRRATRTGWRSRQGSPTCAAGPPCHLWYCQLHSGGSGCTDRCRRSLQPPPLHLHTPCRLAAPLIHNPPGCLPADCSGAGPSSPAGRAAAAAGRAAAPAAAAAGHAV